MAKGVKGYRAALTTQKFYSQQRLHLSNIERVLALTKFFKTKVKAYLTLIRPIGWAPFFFSAILGMVDAGFTNILSVYWFLFILGPLLLGCIYTLNFLSDIEVDKISNVTKDVVMSKQPFVTGDLKSSEGILFASLLVSCGLIFVSFINIETFFLALVLLFIGIVYSFPPRLKDKPFGDVFANAVGGGILCYAMGWSVFQDLNLMPILPALWLTLLLGATYLLTVVIDTEGDKKAGLITTAVFLGENRAIQTSFTLYIISMVFYVAILVNRLSLAYLVLLPLLVRSPYTYYKLYKNPKRVYHVAKRAVASSVIGLILLLLIYTLLSVLGFSGQINAHILLSNIHSILKR